MCDSARRKVADLIGKYGGRAGAGSEVDAAEVLNDLQAVQESLEQSATHRTRRTGLDRALHGQPSPRGVKRT